MRPPAEPVPAGIVDTPAGDVFGDLVRMTDGEPQHRLKAVVVDALGHVDTARAAHLAAERTRDVLAAGGRPPFEELMFGVPARVVAALCGLDQGTDAEAARLIGDFVQCIPASATPEQQKAAALAAGRLQELLGPGIERGRTARVCSPTSYGPHAMPPGSEPRRCCPTRSASCPRPMTPRQA
ncbi:hypothetical protein SALBM311S_00199 [Streptomyces alboniger]